MENFKKNDRVSSTMRVILSEAREKRPKKNRFFATYFFRRRFNIWNRDKSDFQKLTQT